MYSKCYCIRYGHDFFFLKVLLWMGHSKFSLQNWCYAVVGLQKIHFLQFFWRYSSDFDACIFKDKSHTKWVTLHNIPNSGSQNKKMQHFHLAVSIVPTFWDGSGSLDHWIKDPDMDPAFFISGFLDANKKSFSFSKFSVAYYLLTGYGTACRYIYISLQR